MDLGIFKYLHLNASWGYVAFGASLVLVVLKWFHLYSGARAQNFNVSARRTKRFYKMVRDGSWRHALPMELQMAYAEAFGERIDDRHLSFALGRHQPLGLLQDLRRCAGMVALSPDRSCFVSGRGWKVPSLTYRWHSQIAFAAGLVPYLLLALIGGILKHLVSQHALGLILIGFLVWVPFALMMAGWFEAAHRVVEALDERYPAWKGGTEPCAAMVPETVPSPYLIDCE